MSSMVAVRGGKQGYAVWSTNGYAGMHEAIGTPSGDQVLIPAANAQALSVLLKKLPPDQEVTLSLGNDGRILRVEGEAFAWWSAIGESKYPDITQVIPSSSHTEVTVSRQVLIDACQRCHTFRSEQAIYVTLAVDHDELTVSSPMSLEHGSASETVHAQIAGHYPFTVHINYSYLLAALQSCETDEVAIGFPDLSGLDAAFREKSNAAYSGLIITVRPVGDQALTCLVIPVVVGGT